MISTEQIQQVLLHGGHVVGPDGKRIGKVGQVFLDEQTGTPEWVTTATGHFGSGESFVPLSEATIDGDEIHVPYGKDVIKAAPQVDDADGRVTPAEEAELYRHYGLLDPGARREPVTTAPDHDHAPDHAVDDDAMVLSAEQVHVSTERAPAERVRLRKVEVTQDETVTVPVQREEVYLEEVGVDEAGTDQQDRTADPATADTHDTRGSAPHDSGRDEHTGRHEAEPGADDVRRQS